MNFTQNEKISQVTAETIIVRVDISSETHYVRAFNWQGVELGRVFRFANNAEGFGQFQAWIKLEHAPMGCSVCKVSPVVKHKMRKC